MSVTLDRDLIRRLPKVLLHEHLDGGVRPETVLELAEEHGYEDLPHDEPEPLAAWFAEGANRGSLPLYLEGFRHTIALMQTPQALERVAYEALEDLAADGVVYAELRFAPHFHTAAGLGLDAVMKAVLDGLRRASADHRIGYGLIVCALRNEDPGALDQAGRARDLGYREQGCVGFDLAGEEAGHPAKEHVRAFQLAKRMNFAITIHAGESFGPESRSGRRCSTAARTASVTATRLVEDLVDLRQAR